MLESFVLEFKRYKSIITKSIEQVSDEGLNRVLVADGNSVAMLIRHISGNLQSRFSDFLTTDGEKPWRNRDREFEERSYSRDEVSEMLDNGWEVLEGTLSELREVDLKKDVSIRGQSLTVHQALARSLAHLAYHVGQIALLARIEKGDAWDYISIPKGQSEKYNLNPDKERGFKS